MRCEQVKKQYDPTCDPPQSIAEHLARCAPCRQYATELQRLTALLRSEPEIPVPADFNRQLQRRLEAVRTGSSAWWRFGDVRYALPLAAMLVMAVVAVIIMNRPEPSSSSRPGPSLVRAPAKPERESLEVPKKMEVVAARPATPSPPPRESGHSSPSLREGRTSLALGEEAAPQESWLLGGSESSPILLLIREPSGREERLVRLPSVVVGAEAKPAALSLSVSEKGTENVF